MRALQRTVGETGALRSHTGLEPSWHAWYPTLDGVAFYNDSKATNIEAARRAIESFDDGLVVILGGRFKGGAFADLAGSLAARSATVAGAPRRATESLLVIAVTIIVFHDRHR